MTNATSLILHHYDTSPFAEKARVGLGLKGLDWYGVDIPVAMPKPDLTPLTGGYRKTPVLQIGADIYCDTKLIFDEVEQRFPTPSYYPAGNRGLVQMMGRFCDGPWFQQSVAMIFGTIGDFVPDDFKKDREKLMGRAFDTDAMKAALPLVREQLAVSFGWLDQQLADGRDFVEGPAPGLADLHAYLNVWFLGATVSQELAPLLTPTVSAWAERMAGLGHGQKTVLPAADALATAKDASPSVTGEGPRVTVMADDYGKDPVQGMLVADTTERTVLLREDDTLGQIAVHFPKSGFVVIRS